MNIKLCCGLVLALALVSCLDLSIASSAPRMNPVAARTVASVHPLDLGWG